jgi:hypothetical protein
MAWRTQILTLFGWENFGDEVDPTLEAAMDEVRAMQEDIGVDDYPWEDFRFIELDDEGAQLRIYYGEDYDDCVAVAEQEALVASGGSRAHMNGPQWQ